MRFAINTLEVASLNGKRTHITIDIVKSLNKVPNFLADKNEEVEE